MREDRYEKEREKVRASKMPAHAKAARLAHIDMREERNIERRIKASERELSVLRKRREGLAIERDARQRQQVRERMYHDLHRSLSRYEELPEGA